MIETQRLILRPFSKEDARDLFEYFENPTVNCFKSLALSSVEAARDEIERRASDSDCYFAIVLKENGKVIGEVTAGAESADPHNPDCPLDTYSPCWVLNENYQGKGYAYEAAHAVFDYLFNVKNARRIYAYTEDYNLASQHLCEKLGMRREGVFVEFVSFVNNTDGTPIYENTVQYAILKKEWIG